LGSVLFRLEWSRVRLFVSDSQCQKAAQTLAVMADRQRAAEPDK
jgi:hypothetical protein